MRLKAKLTLIILALLAFYGVAITALEHFVIFHRFEEIERKSARENLERAVRAIEGNIEHLDSVCHDWASWDDTYVFATRPNQAYIDSNLVLTTFQDLKIDLLYICDLKGEVLWGKIHDHRANEDVKVADLPGDALPMDSPLLQPLPYRSNDQKDSVSGVFVTQRGPMLVSSRLILMNGNKGTPKGFLIMGVFLNEELVESLSRQTKVIFRVTRALPPSGIIPGDAGDSLGGTIPYTIRYDSNKRLTTIASYPGIRGNPAFNIVCTMNREISWQGRIVVAYSLAILIVTGLLVVLMVMFFMDRTFLRPVSNLTNHLLSISETGDCSIRLKVKRSDEIGVLAREFDHMLEKIEETNAIMEHINDRLMEDLTQRHEMERKLQEANRELERLASVDGLTQLSNRRKFDESVRTEWLRAMRDSSPLSLIIFDVDNFKLYNDTYGHLAGDDCLRAVGGVILKHAMRVSDMAARYGGEEFAVVLPGTNISGALRIAEEIRANVQRLAIPHERSTVEACVTISAGVSCMVPEKGASVQILIEQADKALYEAKAKGRNMVAV